jgi:glycosyltransferase involved in cell wall biosynthesis
LEAIMGLAFDERPNFFANRRDMARLAEIIDQEDARIVHVHASHGHYIGSRAARRANNIPVVVRTNHRGEPLPNRFLHRWIARGWTHGWAAYSKSCLDADVRLFRVPPEHGVVIEGAVALDRFRRGAGGDEKRREFGFEARHVVFGVVARIQPQRRLDVVIEAFDMALASDRGICGLVLGRGTRTRELLDGPLRRRGLADRVLCAGYRDEDYVACLDAMDALIYLAPGSDGSCRAARQAMAMGKPVISSRRGILPELVEDGRCGMVIDDSPDPLAEAMLRLARDAGLRRRMGEAALDKAQSRFSFERQAETIGALYMRLAEEA